MKPRPLKIYGISNVWLNNVPKEHVAPNGSRQFFVLISASTKAEAAAIIGSTVAQLNAFGFSLAGDRIGFKPSVATAEIVKKPRTIYYQAGSGCGRFSDWCEYVPTAKP